MKSYYINIISNLFPSISQQMMIHFTYERNCLQAIYVIMIVLYCFTSRNEIWVIFVVCVSLYHAISSDYNRGNNWEKTLFISCNVFGIFGKVNEVSINTNCDMKLGSFSDTHIIKFLLLIHWNNIPLLFLFTYIVMKKGLSISVQIYTKFCHGTK